jgi:hypothetical protein
MSAAVRTLCYEVRSCSKILLLNTRADFLDCYSSRCTYVVNWPFFGVKELFRTNNYYTSEVLVGFNYCNGIFLSVPSACIRFVIQLVSCALLHILCVKNVDLCVCGHVGKELLYGFRTYSY